MSVREVVIAANWKMNLTAADVDSFMEVFFGRVTRDLAARVIFFPAAPLLPTVRRTLDGRADLGGQNCHWEVAGAFTGEVSVAMLAQVGARHVLVGHSERRQLFGESDDDCRRKVRAVLEGGLEPMLCVGETLDEREAGRQQAVVVRQLSRAVDGLARKEYRRLRIAYEPVWAIGTGRTAAPGDAQAMHAAIRSALASIATPEAAHVIPVLYGGSVRPSNAAELLCQPDVDGALVGGASLDPDAFAAIVAAAPS